MSMKRLTFSNVKIDEESKKIIIIGGNGTEDSMGIFRRLKKIEDILGDDYDLDRLRELVQADRDGRCVVLWAKRGTKIFEIAKTCSCGGNEEKFEYFPDYSDCEACCEECDSCNGIRERVIFSRYELEMKPEGLGKIVFTDKQAAEAALKGERDDKG